MQMARKRSQDHYLKREKSKAKIIKPGALIIDTPSQELNLESQSKGGHGKSTVGTMEVSR